MFASLFQELVELPEGFVKAIRGYVESLRPGKKGRLEGALQT